MRNGQNLDFLFDHIQCYRITAAEIERILQKHHAVTTACVVEVPDRKAGKMLRREMRQEEHRKRDG